ncbi:MAG: biopolymer transporter ExbD [Bacteroidia bacterium]|nr:biopolymer transporter ExbD [Bacteroidia bacterium]
MKAQKDIEKAKKWYSKSALEIDMNPMVDLAFLLITFFMLTTTFSKQQVMELILPVKPKAESMVVEQPVKESKVVTILLSNDDKIFYYNGITEPDLIETSYEENGIRSVLINKNKEIADMVVLVKPLEDSRFKNYVDILDELKLAEVNRYAIIDPDLLDKELIKKEKPG